MVCMARYFEDSAKKTPTWQYFPFKKGCKKNFKRILFKIVKILNNFLLDSWAYSASFAWFGGGVAIDIGVENSYFFPLTNAVIWFTLKFFKQKWVIEILVFVSCYSELENSFTDCNGVSIKLFVKNLFLIIQERILSRKCFW